MTTYAKEDGGSHHGKISAFIVDGDSDGVSIEEMRNKLGLLTMKNAEIYFDNCVVPKKNLLGLKSNPITLAGHQGRNVVYLSTPSSLPFKFQDMLIWTVMGGKVYSLSFSAEAVIMKT